jgi:dienelactone hydrolase
MPLARRILCGAAGVAAAGIAVVSAQTLTVTPARAMADEAAVIRAGGLQPGERIAIRSELVDWASERWTAQAEFVADAQGTVDASKQAPVAGSYREVSPMGLVWSMMPAAKTAAMYHPSPELGPQTIELLLIRRGEPVARAQFEQLAQADGVRRVTLREQGLHGVLFLPATNERRRGVLVLGGSNGGAPLHHAAWLASHGFAALALAYFRYEDLPPKLQAIPLEYFAGALAWMLKRPEILGDRVAVMGTSRGGELALQLGSMFPQIRAVVAYAPANVRYPACCGLTQVPYAWTWRGRPLPYHPPALRRMQPPNGDAVIEVEKTQGPLLLISGEDDGVWRSSAMADAVVQRLKKARFPYPVEHLRYPHAGHSAGRPGIAPAWHGAIKHPVSGREMDLGGTAKGDAQSSIDAAPKVLEFLSRAG